MGIAWCDGAAVKMEAVELRSGGLPLVPDDEPWPACPRCAAPMLFRAQIPLAMTTVVSPHITSTRWMPAPNCARSASALGFSAPP